MEFETLEVKIPKDVLKALYGGEDKIIGAKNRTAVEYLELVIGRREMIVLAEELNADAVLIEDLKARKIAMLRGLNIVGRAGWWKRMTARDRLINRWFSNGHI